MLTEFVGLDPSSRYFLVTVIYSAPAAALMLLVATAAAIALFFVVKARAFMMCFSVLRCVKPLFSSHTTVLDGSELLR